MTDVTLIYPYFRSTFDRSIFRYPPLGLGYVASYLRKNGLSVKIVDCTFINERDALNKVRKIGSPVVGIYSMFTMEENSLRFARLLRKDCDFLVAGGPLPSVDPEKFLQYFDAVVIGEGEETMTELVQSLMKGTEPLTVPGIVYRRKSDTESDKIVHSPRRIPIANLDSIPFPARDLFDNEAYKDYYRKICGYTVTSIISSRGCPFSCDFCSKPVFGDSYRERSAKNIVDEAEDALSLGYERIFFQDDCFTLNKNRVSKICGEILKRKLIFSWECLSRVDSVNSESILEMKTAGCKRIFFGIESGSNATLKAMNKQITVEQARNAVEIAASTKIRTGAFFILGYPGETDETILSTIQFATSLPLDYLSFTLPYPIPGTGLYEKVKNNIKDPIFSKTNHRYRLIDHSLGFQSAFSENKLKFAIAKATMQFKAKKHMRSLYPLFGKPMGILTDEIFKALQ